MANWIVAIDADAERLDAFGRRIEGIIAPLDGLQVASLKSQGFNLVWAANPRAPLDACANGDAVTVRWGEPRDSAGHLQSAQMIHTAWRGGASQQWDGYYAAVSVDLRSRTLLVGTDLLGIFPVYYWSSGRDLILVGTSPELIRSHPDFRETVSPSGLVGILMTNAMVDGEALWQGVRRLGPGCRLRVSDGTIREEESYRVPIGARTMDLPLEGHVEVISDVLGAAIRRHAPSGRDYGQLLSGGIDSRIMAGFLSAQGVRARAFTFGLSTDVEMRCAQRVARCAGFQHAGTEIPADEYPAAARRMARWEHLSSGFANVIEWAAHRHLERIGDRVVSGHILECIIGGTHLHWAYDETGPAMTFERLFSFVNQWGFSPARLKAMLHSSMEELVDERLMRIRAIHDGYSGASGYHRAWMFDLQYRSRFHVGGSLWPLCFTSWPILPFLDRAVLDVAATLPCCSMAGRRVQTAMLVEHFPQLARLPLDRNTFDSRPLVSSARSEIRHQLSSITARLTSKLRRITQRPTPERLYYRRVFDLNTPGWRMVRQLAAPEGCGLPEIFRSEAAASQTPWAHVPVDMSSSISRRAAPLLMLGLNLTLQQSRS